MTTILKHALPPSDMDFGNTVASNLKFILMTLNCRTTEVVKHS